MSDVTPSNWNVYDQYRRGEQRWLSTHSCYEMVVKRSPMAIFDMCGRPVDHKAVFVLLSHLIEFELNRFTGPQPTEDCGSFQLHRILGEALLHAPIEYLGRT